MVYDVWCYWSQGVSSLPPFARLCMKSWNKHLHNKQYKINIFNDCLWCCFIIIL